MEYPVWWMNRKPYSPGGCRLRRVIAAHPVNPRFHRHVQAIHSVAVAALARV